MKIKLVIPNKINIKHENNSYTMYRDFVFVTRKLHVLLERPVDMYTEKYLLSDWGPNLC